MDRLRSSLTASFLLLQMRRLVLSSRAVPGRSALRLPSIAVTRGARLLQHPQQQQPQPRFFTSSAASAAPQSAPSASSAAGSSTFVSAAATASASSHSSSNSWTRLVVMAASGGILPVVASFFCMRDAESCHVLIWICLRLHVCAVVLGVLLVRKLSDSEHRAQAESKSTVGGGAPKPVLSAAELSQLPAVNFELPQSFPIYRFALTGGPCGGKSTVGTPAVGVGCVCCALL